MKNTQASAIIVAILIAPHIQGDYTPFIGVAIIVLLIMANA